MTFLLGNHQQTAYSLKLLFFVAGGGFWDTEAVPRFKSPALTGQTGLNTILSNFYFLTPVLFYYFLHIDNVFLPVTKPVDIIYGVFPFCPD